MEQRSRRSFLGAIAAGGVLTAAGRLPGESVSLLSAGSLVSPFEHGINPRFEERTDIAVHGQYLGSNAALRLVADGQKRPDVVVSADVDLLRDRLVPDRAAWDVTFGANEVGLAYNPDTELGRRLEGEELWVDVLADASPGELAISDPDLDPLGYRAVHLFELAAARYDRPGLREELVEAAAFEPEEAQLLAGVETGSRPVAVAYRNMAVDHGLPFAELPAALNFSDPTLAETYGRVSYETADGQHVRGSPMLYNATVLDDATNPEAGHRFVSTLLDSAALLEEFGVTVPDELPRISGSAPGGLG